MDNIDISQSTKRLFTLSLAVLLWFLAPACQCSAQSLDPVAERTEKQSVAARDNGVIWGSYSRRYLRVCDSRSRRSTRRAPTPSERWPNHPSRRRSPDSRTGSRPTPSGPKPWSGGWVCVWEKKRKVVVCSGEPNRMLASGSSGYRVP